MQSVYPSHGDNIVIPWGIAVNLKLTQSLTPFLLNN